MARTRPYHHGNLRETLLSAALQLIAEAGPQGFTLREIARRAGVSHNAPYRHFRDKNELLAAVAAQGFEELTRAMRRSAKGAAPLEKLRAAGLAYVAFALRRPQHFTVMFDTSFDQGALPSGIRAFETLLSLLEDCQRAGQLPAGDPRRLALAAWSLVHGIAKLALAGSIPGPQAGVLDFARFAISSSFGGLTKTLT
jgi:AcrR family transcriptional regulator